LHVANHLSKLLLLYGQTLATSTNLICLYAIGRTHLNLSSFIVFAICIAITGYYPETARCVCTLPNPLHKFRNI